MFITLDLELKVFILTLLNLFMTVKSESSGTSMNVHTFIERSCNFQYI
jgi:hypothetical protein